MTRPAGDDGRILVLVIGMVVVLAMLVGVVVDAGRLYLARRSLDGVTDAAALAGAQSLDLDAVYSGAGAGAGEALPLDGAGAGDAVDRYLRRADAGRGFRDFAVADVDVDGTEVTVTTVATVRLPFVGRITRGRTEVRVTSTSTARNRFAP